MKIKAMTNPTRFMLENVSYTGNEVRFVNEPSPQTDSILENPIKTYTLPKEFAARVAVKFGQSYFTIAYADVPLTNRNIIESHIFTRCVMLENGGDIYPVLVDIYKRIQKWGEQAERPGASYDGMTAFLHLKMLNILGDKIRYLPHNLKETGMYPPEVSKAFIKVMGLKPKDLYANIIKHIEHNAPNFQPKEGLLKFLLGQTTVVVSSTAFYIKDRVNNNSRGSSPVLIDTTETHDIDCSWFLTRMYMRQHKQWFNSGSWVEVEGEQIYVDHHNVYETDGIDTYYRKHPRFPQLLPFHHAPNDYFAERIQTLAEDIYKTAAAIRYPTDFRAYVDITGSEDRQLVTGLDLVNEGVTMKHCVGGARYQESIKYGASLYFHIALPNDKYGATVSLDKTSASRAEYYLGGKYWYVDQFYGFDDREMGSEEWVILRNFLTTHLKPMSVTSIRNIEGRSVGIVTPFLEEQLPCRRIDRDRHTGDGYFYGNRAPIDLYGEPRGYVHDTGEDEEYSYANTVNALGAQQQVAGRAVRRFGETEMRTGNLPHPGQRMGGVFELNLNRMGIPVSWPAIETANPFNVGGSFYGEHIQNTNPPMLNGVTVGMGDRIFFGVRAHEYEVTINDSQPLKLVESGNICVKGGDVIRVKSDKSYSRYLIAPNIPYGRWVSGDDSRIFTIAPDEPFTIPDDVEVSIHIRVKHSTGLNIWSRLIQSGKIFHSTPRSTIDEGRVFHYGKPPIGSMTYGRGYELLSR